MPKRIIIVEDNPGDVELLRTAFEAATDAAELTFVQDGERAVGHIEALRKREGLPDLVLFDLNLPRDSTWKVVELLARDDYRSVPRAAMSAVHPTSRLHDRLAREGVRTVLVKPPTFVGFGRFIRALYDLMPAVISALLVQRTSRVSATLGHAVVKRLA